MKYLTIVALLLATTSAIRLHHKKENLEALAVKVEPPTANPVEPPVPKSADVKDETKA